MKQKLALILFPILLPLTALASFSKINKIYVEAPAGINTQSILETLRYKEGDRVSEADLNIELKRLYNSGIYRNIIFEPRNIDKDNIDLKIIAFPKLTFGNIEFMGSYKFTFEQLQNIWKIEPGDEFSQEIISRGIEQIRNAYREIGFNKTNLYYEPTAGNKPMVVDIKIKISEGKATLIDKIEISGVEDEYKNKLKKELGLGKGNPFKDEELEDGLKRLRFKLYSDHYLESEIQNPTIQYENDRRSVLISIPIKSGPKYEFVFEGNSFLSRKKLLKITTPVEEDFLGSLSVEDIMSGIIREYHLQGFHFVTVSYSIDNKFSENEKIISYSIEEGPRVLIKDFEFPNIKHFSKEFYKGYILDHGTPLLRSGYLNVPDLEIALDSIVDFLNSKGYLNAELGDYKLQFSEDRSTVNIEVLIDEDVQTKIDSVNFSGNARFANERLYEVTKLKAGSPLTFYELKQAERALIRFYQEEGFYYIKIRPSGEFPQVHFKDENRLADLYFSIEEGDQIYFGEIFIRGQVQTNEEVIRRQLTFSSGDILTPSAIRKSESNISRTGIFQSVIIRPINPDPSVSAKKILVLVNERNPGIVEFGAGVASDDGPRGYAGFAYKNFMGWNRTVSTRVEANRPFIDYRFIERLVNVGFEEPYLFGTPLIYRLNLIYLKEQSFTFDEERLEARSIFEKSFTDWFKMFFYYSFQSRDVIPINTAGTTENDSLLGMLGPTITFEFRDDLYNPNKGHYHSIWTDFAEPAFGSQDDVGFFRIQEQSSLYVPIFDYFTFALAFNAGYLRSTTGQQVPVDKRFYLGGRKTVRGFQEWSLGAVPAGTSVTESYYLNPRAELRFPLYWGFAGAIFYDGGNVFFPGEPQELFRSTVGPSLRFITPVGPLSIDLGIVLDPLPGEDNVRVHFAVGTF